MNLAEDSVNHQVGYQTENMESEHNDTKNIEVQEFRFVTFSFAQQICKWDVSWCLKILSQSWRMIYMN